MLYNPDLRTAVIMIPGLCGIILVFVGTVATALGVVRERQSGTMEQLAVMPFRPRDVFLGKIAPYLLIAAADMVIVVVAGMLLFDVPFRGSVATFALGALLFLFVTLGTGVLISTVSQTQGQAMQLAVMTMVPQFLLSGLFFPLYSMPWAVRWIGYLLPLTWFIKVARGVMVRGAPLGALWLPLTILAVMAVVVFTASTLRFRRDLAPAGRRDDAGAGPAGRTRRRGDDGGGAMSTADAGALWGVQDLTVRYGSHVALDGVTLEVPRGTVTAVIGGDGAGKTTLLRVLAGVVRPSAGAVRRPQRRRVGYVAGASGVYGDLSVDENIAFVAGAYGLTDRGTRRTDDRPAGSDRARRVSARGSRARLSGGMRQKLAFALAMLHGPTSSSSTSRPRVSIPSAAPSSGG